jgi:hypothetical protein
MPSMSTPQRTRARVNVVVDRETADVLRVQAKKVMSFGHDLFEDFEDFCPEAQHALATRFCDATAIITAVGWDPDAPNLDTETVEITLTDDLIEQLRRRRYDLAFTNRDRLDGLDLDHPIDPDLLAEITEDRLAAQALDRLFGTYATARGD